MILEQHSYPFPDNGIISFSSDNSITEKRRYRQIGIEHPHSIPMIVINNYINNNNEYNNYSPVFTSSDVSSYEYDIKGWPPIIVILDPMTDLDVVSDTSPHNFNNTGEKHHHFATFDKDIYEVGLNGDISKIIIQIPEKELQNPYLIINAAYEIAD